MSALVLAERLVFGTIFAVTGRIWMLMIAHAAFDLTALWIIYWDLETKVAHFFFKVGAQRRGDQPIRSSSAARRPIPSLIASSETAPIESRNQPSSRSRPKA